jgi:hypothetical protein
MSAMHVPGPGVRLWAPEPLHPVVLEFLDASS